MILFAVEEFAARRRKAQTELEDRLRDTVAEAVDLTEDTGGWDKLLDLVQELFSEVYEDDAGEPYPKKTMPGRFRTELLESLRKTTAPRTDATARRITVWLATAILAEATIAAALADSEELFLEWVDMNDKAVRETHEKADGQRQPIGEPFTVGGEKMRYPGDPTVPPELFLNCRCVLRPVLASEILELTAASDKPWDGSASRFTPEEWKRSTILHVCDGLEKSCHKLPIREPGGALSRAGVRAAAGRIGQVDASPEQVASAKRALRGAYRQIGEEVPDSLTAAAEQNTATVIVALPSEGDPIHPLGPEHKHSTLLWFGEIEDVEAILVAAERMAKDAATFAVETDDVGTLGDDEPQAVVLHLQVGDLGTIRDSLLEDEAVLAAFQAQKQWPQFTPHVTLGYGDDVDDQTRSAAAQLGEIRFDRLAVWQGDQQTEFALGDPMTETKPEAQQVEDPVQIPWHGVLAPEGVASGDGRMFAPDSLRMRELPLPLTWQKASSDGHSGSVTVAKIEKIERRDGLMRASGYFLATSEADEVVGLLSDFGKFGVSVDADDATYEVDEEQEMVIFSSARIASASIVAIPAFAEAYVSLGHWDDEDETPPVEAEVPPVEEAAMFTHVNAAITEDGPGWLTNPVDTDRLRDYWVSGPGAAKIAWGTPGDFNRCRINVAEYVKPQHLNGYCANRHYDALGFWPGRGAHASDTLKDTEAADAISLVAAGGLKAPAEWFCDPKLDGPTPLTVTDDGRVFGHIAAWGTCHIGLTDTCVSPPPSLSEYAYFLTGEVALDNGRRVPVGNLTIGGGHAAPRLGLRPTLDHYDSTSAVVSDVTCGDDDHGIWYSGWIRPGTSEEMVTAFRASALSGDWRKVGGGMELVAALAVNVPGFGIPRVRVAASSEGQLSLVASGVIAPAEANRPTDVVSESIAADLVESVVREIEQRQERRGRMASLAAKMNGGESDRL